MGAPGYTEGQTATCVLCQKPVVWHDVLSDGNGNDVVSTEFGFWYDAQMGTESCGAAEDTYHGIEVQDRIQWACKEAGLGVMVQVYEIVSDREEVDDGTLLQLTADDVNGHYWGYVGPAIDQIEIEMEGT